MACISIAEADHCALREERICSTYAASAVGCWGPLMKIIPEACFQKG